LIGPGLVVVTLGRSNSTTDVRTTHQAAEPRNTPSVIVAAPARSPGAIPSPANSAANDRIVIGLVSVSARIRGVIGRGM